MHVEQALKVKLCLYTLATDITDFPGVFFLLGTYKLIIMASCFVLNIIY